jgi:CheY-like chemotaxis protein
LNDPQYRINEAADGQQAINILKQQKFDVAILDVMMPGIDGIELCTYIRNMPTTEIIPIIMITSLNSMEDILEIEQAGATMYLERPFDAKKLRKLLSEVTRAKNASNR